MKRYHQFIKWMKGYIILYLFSVALLIVLQYFRTLSPLFITHVVDTVLGDEGSPLPNLITQFFIDTSVEKQLLNVSLVYVSFTLFRVIVMFFRRVLNAYFTESIAYNMRNSLYKKLQDLSYTYHNHAETGDLIQRCTTDVDTYRNFVGEQLIEIFRLVFLVSLTIYQMSLLNVKLTIISVVITPIIFIAALVYFIYVKRVFKEVEEAEGKMTTTLQETITGIRVVKTFAKEQDEIKRFDVDSKVYLQKDFRLLKLMAVFWGGTDFIIFIQYALTLSFGIVMYHNGEITIGEYVAFLSFIGMIVWPLRQLGRIVGDFGKTSVALDRIDEIMIQKSEHEDDSDNEPEIRGEIEFRNVYFRFEEDNEPLLKNLNFKINKGETVAIVGKTGSGKSTLINLLVRLLETTDGTIYIDGVPIRNINKKHLRKNIGIILQEPFLYSRTLYENIGIMNPSAPEEKIYKAASIAALHEDIIGFDHGYKTIVGERGVTLSGGQKQRVAIARMLLGKKPVLIFDDSLSAVDTETDLQIRKALHKYWQDTTVLLITHRITTAMEADKIIVLDKGEIIQMGTHNELINQEGLYNELWKIQTDVKYDYLKLREEV